MENIKIISFDVEGTLNTTDFSYAVWFEAIPKRYADLHKLSLEEAKEQVEKAYSSVGEERLEWYDIRYWCRRFDIGSWESLMGGIDSRVAYYPEVIPVLEKLSCKYPLIIASASPREFLRFHLAGIDKYFNRVFSSVSDFGQLKSARFFRAMCSDLGISPGQVAHIGDNLRFDYESAQEAVVRAFYLDRSCKNASMPRVRDLSEFADFFA